MGGNAFASQAARLTIPEYDAFRAFLHAQLTPFFGPVDTSPYLSTKSSHGDVDMFCGWEGVGWATGKGRAEGRVGAGEVDEGGEAGEAGEGGGADVSVEVAVGADASAMKDGVAGETELVAQGSTGEDSSSSCRAGPSALGKSETDTGEPEQTEQGETNDGVKASDDVSELTTRVKDLSLPASAALPATPAPASSPRLADALAAAGLSSVTITSPPEQLDKWCEIVARSISGTHWLRLGSQVSVAVPIAVVKEALAAAGPAEPSVPDADAKPFVPFVFVEPKSTAAAPDTRVNHLSPMHPFSDLVPQTFVQVDLMFMPPAGVHFQVWSYAYSASVLLLSQLVRRASGCNDFIMHGHRAVLRFSPYPQCPKVEVHLTNSAADLCAYLGLDYGKWEALRANTHEDLFAWFADCAPESRAARGLRRMARYGKIDGTYKKGSKQPVLDEFGAYLREHGWVPEERENKEGANGGGDDDDKANLPASTGLRLPRDPVHPDEPLPLPRTHAALVRYWGKEEEYAAALAAVRPAAEQRWLSMVREAERGKRAAEGGAASGDGAKDVKPAVDDMLDGFKEADDDAREVSVVVVA